MEIKNPFENGIDIDKHIILTREDFEKICKGEWETGFILGKSEGIREVFKMLDNKKECKNDSITEI